MAVKRPLAFENASSAEIPRVWLSISQHRAEWLHGAVLLPAPLILHAKLLFMIYVRPAYLQFGNFIAGLYGIKKVSKGPRVRVWTKLKVAMIKSFGSICWNLGPPKWASPFHSSSLWASCQQAHYQIWLCRFFSFSLHLPPCISDVETSKCVTLLEANR